MATDTPASTSGAGLSPSLLTHRPHQQRTTTFPPASASHPAHRLNLHPSRPPRPAAVSNPALNFAERVKYIPIRLDLKERQFLRLLEAALLVSEYTDKARKPAGGTGGLSAPTPLSYPRPFSGCSDDGPPLFPCFRTPPPPQVDIAVFRNKAQRITNQLQQICSILSGLVVASDYKLGLELIADKDFKQNEQLFQFVFELGRRHKIMNPEKMRTECAKPEVCSALDSQTRLKDHVTVPRTSERVVPLVVSVVPVPPRYGKLVYLLQDSLLYDVQQLLEFKIVKPLNVRCFLAMSPFPALALAARLCGAASSVPAPIPCTAALHRLGNGRNS